MGDGIRIDWPATIRAEIDRFSWPARRWLADHLIGGHAYSRNVAFPTVDTGMNGTSQTVWRYSNYAHDQGLRITVRNPGETA